MAFEDELRSMLKQDADALPVPHRLPSRAAERARQRQRHRRAVAGVAAATAVAAAVATPMALRSNGHAVNVSSGSGAGTTLLPTGPLVLRWKATAGGLTADGYRPLAVHLADGSIYALSTGPGVRMSDIPAKAALPRSLYRLADDGTWQPLALDGSRPRAVDLAGSGDLLYALSTGPDANGHVGARLSTSTDHGETWATDAVAAVPDPSSSGMWDRYSTMTIASSGGHTVALVTTTFNPSIDKIFPELAQQQSDLLNVDARADGLALVRSKGSGAGADATKRKEALASGASPAAPSTTMPPVGQTTTPADEVLRVVPWSDLGVSGPDDFRPVQQLFRRTADAWAQVAPPAVMAGLDGLAIQAAGDGFVTTGWTAQGGAPTVLASPDGITWSALSLPADGQVVAVEGALVDVPSDGNVLHVSTDGGASWQAVDLAAKGVAADARISGVAAGPVGLVFAVGQGTDANVTALVTSADLSDFTVTPLADVLDTTAKVARVSAAVSTDRVVLTAQLASSDTTHPATSVTAIGTPVRQR